MSTTETISIHDLQQQVNLTEQEQNTDNTNEHVRGEQDSDKKRLLALVGSALSQLPIWGTPALRYPLISSN
jgi:hypothetical protein